MEKKRKGASLFEVIFIASLAASLGTFLVSSWVITSNKTKASYAAQKLANLAISFNEVSPVVRKTEKFGKRKIEASSDEGIFIKNNKTNGFSSLSNQTINAIITAQYGSNMKNLWGFPIKSSVTKSMVTLSARILNDKHTCHSYITELTKHPLYSIKSGSIEKKLKDIKPQDIISMCKKGKSIINISICDYNGGRCS